MEEDEMRSRTRLLQDLAIKRNALDQARGCLGEVATMYDCDQYESFLTQAQGILTRIINEARPHKEWHTPRGH